MKKVISLIIITFLITNFSQAMTDKQMLILQQVLNVDQGKVTKQMHTDFWNDVPNKDEVSQFMETTGLMAKITRDGMKYQMELWKSALISYQNEQVFKSDEYLKVNDTMNDLINRISKNIPDANEREQVINQMKTSMINSNNLLKSAASRTDMQSVQGPIVEISEERIKFVISNIEKSFSRIDKLLKPEWAEAQIEEINEEQPRYFICENKNNDPLYIKFHKTDKVWYDWDKQEWAKVKNLRRNKVDLDGVIPTLEAHEDKSRFENIIFKKKIFPIYISDRYYVFYQEVNDTYWFGGDVNIYARHIIMDRYNLNILDYQNQKLINLYVKFKYDDQVIEKLFKESNQDYVNQYETVEGSFKTFKGRRKLINYKCSEIKQKI
tara:strand:+ start:904 stop:2043 length:1140 start_codon:yes stop_codon:yes gene_type:complete